MAGLIGAVLAGAAAGGGEGVAQAGSDMLKAYDANEHEKLKSQLATERETSLENLRAQSAKDLQGTELASREKEGAAGRASAETIAAAGRASAEKVAGMHTASNERIASMQRDLTLIIEREKATPMVDDRGNVLMVGHDGKPKGYLMTPDGKDRFKSPSLKAGAKEYAESISHQLADLGRAELNPQTMMDPDAMRTITRRRIELTAQLSQILSTGEVPKAEAPKAPDIKDPFKGGGGKPKGNEVAPGDQVNAGSTLVDYPPGTVEDPTPDEVAAASEPARGALPQGARSIVQRVRLQHAMADAKTNPALY